METHVFNEQIRLRISQTKQFIRRKQTQLFLFIPSTLDEQRDDFNFIMAIV